MTQVSAEAEKNLPRDSAGDVVTNDQQARESGPSNPPSGQQVVEADGRVTPQILKSNTNAEGFTPNANKGLNNPTLTGTNSQAITTPDGATTQAGASGNNEDTGDANRNSTQQAVDAAFGGANARIEAQPNILDKYSSYTYAVSIYLMSPDDYAKLLTTKKKRISGSQLLIQSGGAPQGTFTSPAEIDPAIEDPVQAEAESIKNLGRNQFFPLDFYLDDIVLKSLISGKGTQGAHNVAEISFKIIEPNGISLLDNLYQATQQYNRQLGKVGEQNYAAQNYLMIIRFYGYDENGNLVAPNKSDPSGQSDSKAIVEKFIPFQFTTIGFRVANRLTEYTCTAVCPQNVVATGQGRGVIPFNVELTSTTLQNLLNGNVATASTTQTPPDGRAVGTGAPATGDTNQNTQGGGQASNNAPPKANAAPTPTVTAGLAQALNKFQEERVKDGTYEIADTYKFVIVESVLQNATVTPPGPTNLKNVSMNKDTTAAGQKDGTKQSVDNNTKASRIVAGTSIVQFLNQLVRTSSFIYEQQTKVVNKDGEVIPQGTPANAFAWYRIGVEAKPNLGKGYDNKRNDYAYDITYQISMYKISDIKSDFFPEGRFVGAHKKYNYWFTGENVAVLNFEQDFNYLYYVTINTQTQPKTPVATSNYREVEKRLFSPNSGQSSQGTEGNQNEPSANAADYLYSPSDQSRVKLTIVGDPAWMQQGEIWSGVSKDQTSYNAFLPDGTINYEAQEILFELAWNKPVDYNITTGLMDPGQKNLGANRKAGKPGDAAQSYIYKAVTVTNTLSRGKFTQDLEGVLVIFPMDEEKKAVQETQRTEETPSAPASVPGFNLKEYNAAVAKKGNLPRGYNGKPNNGLNIKAINAAAAAKGNVPRGYNGIPNAGFNLKEYNAAAAAAGPRGRGAPPLAVPAKPAVPATSGGVVVGGEPNGNLPNTPNTNKTPQVMNREN